MQIDLALQAAKLALLTRILGLLNVPFELQLDISFNTSLKCKFGRYSLVGGFNPSEKNESQLG